MICPLTGLENGGGGQGTGAPLVPHDIIRFSPNTKDRIFEICSPLYENGLSLREIERQTGVAKSSIRDVLRSHGMDLRRAVRGQKKVPAVAPAMQSGITPYGYCYLDGRLVVDTREHNVVLQIVGMWKLGKSFTAIAATRQAGRWYHATVQAIVQRYLEEKNES